MSQPTRARTTGGARKPRNTSSKASPPESTPAPEAATPTDSVGAQPAAPVAPGGIDNPLAPETLARTLRAVAAELERDPDLARRVAAAVAADSASIPPTAHPTEHSASDIAVVGASGGRPGSPPPAGSRVPAETPGFPPERSLLQEKAGQLALREGGTGAGSEDPTPRLNRSFHPRLVTGASPDFGSGIPDPFALYQKLGADGLRAALDELRLGTLHAIVREHGLDPKGTLSRQNDAAKLRAAILAAAAKGQK